jgi:hypothetical protein
MAIFENRGRKIRRKTGKFETGMALQRSQNLFSEKSLILLSYALHPHQPAAGFKNRKIFHFVSFLRAGGIFLKNEKKILRF